MPKIKLILADYHTIMSETVNILSASIYMLDVMALA